MWQNVPTLVDVILLEKLGKGGNGVVYRAKSNSMGLVAAKTLHILLQPDKFYVEAEGEVYLKEEDHFRQEVETMMKFSHPNIVKCFGVWFKSEGARKIPHMIFELGDCALDAFLFSINFLNRERSSLEFKSPTESIFAHAALNCPQRHQAWKYGIVHSRKCEFER